MAEHQRQRTSAKAEARMERKMAEAEKVLSERDMRERGEDVERARAWEYSIEDNERWEKKLEERERKKDQGPVGESLGFFSLKRTAGGDKTTRRVLSADGIPFRTDFADAAERSYQRQISQLKPDLARYNAQRAALNGAGSSSSSGSSQALVSRSGPGGSGKGQVVRHEDLYRDYNSLSYGDHKPDDAAIDRVVGNINLQ